MKMRQDPITVRAGRRRLLKALTGGSVAALAAATLPERWVRPAVDAVVIPAHAQATTNCVLRGTRVRMADGRHVPIESLRVGDLVAAGPGAAAPLTAVTKAPAEHLRDHFYRINEDLCVTGDHPVLVEHGGRRSWRRADTLAEGDRMCTAAGPSRIDVIRRVNVPVFAIYLETASGSMVAGAAGFVVRSRYQSLPQAAYTAALAQPG